MIIGYARVSTADQHSEAQEEALKKYGCDRVFVDKESGTKDDRPQFLLMKECLRPGDTVVVTELSRLGRRLLSVLDFVQYLKDNNINFVSFRENIDLSSPSGELIVNIMASISAFERQRLLERQRVGIASALARGIKFGRRPCDKKKVDQAVKLYKAGSLSVKEIADVTGLSKATIYREINKLK